MLKVHRVSRLLRGYRIAAGTRNVNKLHPRDKNLEKTQTDFKLAKTSVDAGTQQVSRKANRDKGSLIAILHEKYNPHYERPDRPDLCSVNRFFNSARVRYEWSAATFLDIPGERLRQKAEENALTQASREDGSEPAPDDTRGGMRPKKRYGKTDGIPFELLNGLPEVAFLGRCNAGKSTLLNNITTEFSHVRLQEHAKASKKAGFTKTINCFNIGGRFRIVDTPGYGGKSTQEQGDMTMRYLRERQELKRCFLLVSAEQGFAATDSQVVDFLTKFGIPFEVIFTKMDKIKDISQLESVIEESGVLELPTLPQMIFLNSETNKRCPKRYGIDTLRSLILESCGLEPNVKPSKIREK
ncbi:LAQU0S10e01970g1_1 [Lachancea quebecensis]|uniref:LAQU0S10e01970g1_1 n=1 Tax=Lachancea quebecensis TaxID=1654605 RepID=A0A0P1KW51_9SACH|nr:LAQU0S10e01970g1_1 [Lachancea quebecensis]